jgi:hypothetical protein
VKLLAALFVLGIVLTATVVPGVFTTDDNNYLATVLALRQGHVTIANTAGLTPSRELLAFDPGPWARAVSTTPVAPSAPPLYALLALPFSVFGWRGLVALNTLAFLIAIAVAYVYAGRYGDSASTPWIAAAALGLGGFAIEYAQGVWPHALSLALVTAGIFAAGVSIDDDRPDFAAIAGFLLALATGVRYQNAVILAAVAAGLALLGGRRAALVAAYGFAAAVPLAISGAINHARLGSWNPISKGPGYLDVPLLGDAAGEVFAPFTMLWARLVDFTARPPLAGFSWVTYDQATGAHLMMGSTPQKAILQSAPWAILGLILFVLAWAPRFAMPERRRLQLRLHSLVAAALLATFALAEVHRHEGLSFNQRYLLELLPLVAVATAWALDALEPAIRPLVGGSIWGVLIVLAILSATPAGGSGTDPLFVARQLALLKTPLLLSASIGVLWFFATFEGRFGAQLASAAGMCLAWGLTLHLADDVAASHRLRERKLEETRALDGVLPDDSALVAYTGYKDAAFPLLFDRDIVILDARADEGRDAPRLVGELLDRGRRVFVLESGFPGVVLSRVVEGWDAEPVRRPGTRLVELRARPE